MVLGFAMPLSAPLGWLHYLLQILAQAIIAFTTPRRAVLVLTTFALILSTLCSYGCSNSILRSA